MDVHPSSTSMASAVGQSFTGNGDYITKARFYIFRMPGVVAGAFVTAEVYAHNGTFGDSSVVPSGQPLAASNTIPIMDMSLSSPQWVTFDFDGTFKTQAGTHYFIVLVLSGVMSSSSLQVEIAANASNGGLQVGYQSSIWHTRGTVSTYGVLFEVLGVSAPSLFSVVYDANRPAGTSGSGSVPIDNNTYAQGASVTVLANPGNLTTSGGYSFLGWASNPSATTPSYVVSGNNVSPSSFTMGSANVTLYAIWQQNSSTTYAVTYSNLTLDS
jgi:hypothetical protein